MNPMRLRNWLHTLLDKLDHAQVSEHHDATARHDYTMFDITFAELPGVTFTVSRATPRARKATK